MKKSYITGWVVVSLLILGGLAAVITILVKQNGGGDGDEDPITGGSASELDNLKDTVLQAQAQILTNQQAVVLSLTKAVEADSKADDNAAQLSTVEAKADTALSDADTAQTTADTAQTSADTAQTTADSAVASASSAQTTANSALSTAQTTKGKIDDLTTFTATGATVQTLNYNSWVQFNYWFSSGTNPPTIDTVDGKRIFLPGPNRRWLVTFGGSTAAYPTGHMALHWKKDNQSIPGTFYFVYDTHSGAQGGGTEYGSYVSGSFQIEVTSASSTIVWNVIEKTAPNGNIRSPNVFITELLN